MNCELMQKSATLQQYSHLIALFRDYQARGPITSQVIEEIMQICLAEGILVELVEKHGKTLLDFLHFEISQEDALEMSREDGFEIGFEKGHSDGLSQGKDRVNELYKKLREAGRLEDFDRSVTDSEYQDILLKEFGLSDNPDDTI